MLAVVFGRQTGEGGFGVFDMGEGRVGEEQGGVIWTDEDAGKGTFAVEGAGSGLEG